MKHAAILIFSALVTLGNAWALDDAQMLRAIELDNISSVKKSIESGSHNVNSKITVRPATINVPLVVVAAKEASLNTLKFLIESKADLNAPNPLNETALMYAAFFRDSSNPFEMGNERHVEAVNLLIAAGANLEGIPGAYGPLAYAAYGKNENVVKILLSKGANPNGGAEGSSSKSNTPLIMATLSRQDRIVHLLLENGADPRIVNNKNRDALYFAKRDGLSKIAGLLTCALNLKSGEAYSAVCR